MALDGELVTYVCQSSYKDSKVTKKIAWNGYAYTRRRKNPGVAYWYCDQRKICGASLIERDGVFTRKGISENRSKSGWDADGNHVTHPPDLERIENEISRRTNRQEKRKRLREKKAAREAKGVQDQRSKPSMLNNVDSSCSADQNDIRIDKIWSHSHDIDVTGMGIVGGIGIKNNLGTSNPSEGSNKSENLLLIDTDGGCYDAWALVLAFAATAKNPSKNTKIVGITTVNGCTSIDNAVLNVGRILQLVGKKVPVYKGVETSLLGTLGSTQRPQFFGTDGCGDPVDLPPLLQDQKVESDNGVNAIIKLAEKYKGKLKYIALGPLTNLAMAVKLKPEIKNYFKEIFIMGGNSEGVGNMTISSEFNFHVDPEAAHIVLQSFGSCPVYLLPWETCVRSAASSYDFRTNVIGSISSPEMELLNKMESTILNKFRDQWLAPDAVVTACCINPRVIRKTEHYHCSVELQGNYTRGMMVVDKNFVHQRPSNVTLIMEVNLMEYENMLLQAVGGHDSPQVEMRMQHHDNNKMESENSHNLTMNQRYF